MADVPALSIVFGYRNRDVERVQRCLASLAAQTNRDFEVLFVDYGSATPLAQASRALLQGYPFARYLYSDARGQPWNRARALNIGVRRAAGRYILTTDVDLIFAPNMVEVALQHASDQHLLHLLPHMLPHGFQDWANMERYRDSVPRGSESMRGAFQLAAAQHWHRLHGFDEFYRYYGVEDRDLAQRMARSGVPSAWLPDETAVYHQWHPAVTHQTKGVVPEQVWARMNVYYELHKERLPRNDDDWGRIIASEERPVFAFVEPEHEQLIEHERLQHFLQPPDSTQSVAYLIRDFFALPGGHALAVQRADFPHRPPWLTALLARANGMLKRLRVRARLGYSPNLLHDGLLYLLEQAPQHVADYYLDANGVSVIVKRDAAS